MLSKSQFIHAINSGSGFADVSLESLSETVAKYPYCQSLQLLYCKQLHQNENPEFERQLRIAAAYAADRKKLHALVLAEAKATTLAPAEEETEAPQVVDQPKAEENDAAAIEVEAAEQPQEPEPVAETTAEESNEGEVLLEQQILTQAISSSILLEASALEEESLEIPTEEEAPIAIEATEEQEIEVVEDEFDEAETHTFSEWLQHLSDAPEEEAIEEEETSKPSYITSKKPKTAFYSPSKMARLSVTEDDDLVTETLAKVYAMQGNIEKAIKAYHKLGLKYPEKRVYFADQIKKLEEQL